MDRTRGCGGSPPTQGLTPAPILSTPLVAITLHPLSPEYVLSHAESFDLATCDWCPRSGLVACGCSHPQNSSGAIALSSLLFAGSLYLLFQLDLSDPALQMQEYIRWIPTLGLNYSLGVDGLSLPLVVLTNLLTLAVVYSAAIWIVNGVNGSDRQRLFYVLVLLANAGIVGGIGGPKPAAVRFVLRTRANPLLPNDCGVGGCKAGLRVP